MELNAQGLNRYSRLLATVSSLFSWWFLLVEGFTNSARLTRDEITSSARLTSGTGADFVPSSGVIVGDVSASMARPDST